ncbi:[NiFe]-hydrogenase assembly chaperone HybE [Halomonas cerina]|uniref:[NiFe]-hydrogenase assembly chaperone HybE n=1 Tax=Halomonas cerina TaxID=447424 RepID=A0A839V6L7_9GAMM|nr:[NiFe]-hydrogenase assembly chaperone HybE [Halomonas cerina]MBB3189189.1 hypothetical protein [Halomonas cerina]
MKALHADQYDRLRRLGEAWRACHLKAAKQAPCFNPRLGVDALCFQPFSLASPDDSLLGTLVTPVSLSLALVPSEPDTDLPDSRLVMTVSLPSGTYPFRHEVLSDAVRLWRCELLDDLSDVDSLQEASRLAQRLMERVMTPARP